MTETSEPFSEDTVLRFARGTRLQYDPVREQWFIQAPEKAFIADPSAAEILQLIDGKRTLGTVTDKLLQKFSATRDVLVHDVLHMTRELADKQVLQVV